MQVEGKEIVLGMKNKQGILSEKENDCLKKGKLGNSKDEKDSIVLEKDRTKNKLGEVRREIAGSKSPTYKCKHPRGLRYSI